MSSPEDMRQAIESVFAALTMDEFTRNEDVDEIHRAALAALPAIEKACGEREAWKQIQQEIKESLLWNGLKMVVREDGRWVVRPIGTAHAANTLPKALELLEQAEAACRTAWILNGLKSSERVADAIRALLDECRKEAQRAEM